MDKVKLEACPEECWHDATEKPDHGEAVIAEYHEYDDPARPAREHVVWWWEDQWRTYPNVDDLAYVNRWRRIPSARPTPEPSGEVIQADAISFLEHAFRNIDLPPLSPDDMEDIRRGLSRFLTSRHRLTQGTALTDQRDHEGRSTAGEDRVDPALMVGMLIERICLDVAELPDRTSPDDWPEAMLVTSDELAEVIRAAFDETDIATLTPPPSDAVREAFMPMNEWDQRDETVLLLVDYTDGDHPLDDADVAITIGHNNDHNTDEVDGWKFAGWCWSHDHYVEGKGKPIGWMPLPHHLATLTSTDIAGSSS